MFEINVRSDLEGVVARMQYTMQRQAPFAMAKALTMTAKIAENNIRDNMRDVFDRPNNWTLGGTYVSPATKTSLRAMVKLKDEWASGSSVPARKYLQYEIAGGERSLKRYEKALRAVGALPEGMFTVPASGAQLDGNGNIARKQIVQLLSYFRAFRNQGYTANSTKATRAKLAKGTRTGSRFGVAYFVGRPGGGKLPLGIWSRTKVGSFGWALKPILLFSDTASYRPRFNFRRVVEQTVDAHLLPVFRLELAEALRTAK